MGLYSRPDSFYTAPASPRKNEWHRRAHDAETTGRSGRTLAGMMNSEPQAVWVNQALPVCPMQCEADEHASTAEQDWECAACAYPDRTGDLRSVIKLSDFYSTRQLHSSGLYQGMRKSGIEHELMLCLPNDSGAAEVLARVWSGFLRARPRAARVAAPPPARGLPGPRNTAARANRS